ncbi:MAG: DegT/DnrJ/EryC1/StrS aminotransferase family protein [Demequina sp.]|nr:DegT/DnrJ/EryC1/StrS aminotransferase family protein [Demequina sp.]
MARHEGQVTRRLAELTGTRAEDWFLVFQARYGMLQTFAALAAHRPGRSVVTQLLTCATAVDPILVAGLSPGYAEVSPDTLSIDPQRLALDEGAGAVVIQHTFGIVDDDASRRVARAARDVGALVCEDSAHCVGRMAHGEDGTPLADVSFHSFGVEKMLPTKFGGAVWVSPELGDPELRAAIVEGLAGLTAPSVRLRFAARTYRYQLALVNRLPGAVRSPLRTMLIRAGLFAPAVAPEETAGGLAHGPASPSRWVMKSVATQLEHILDIERHRVAAVQAYVGTLGAELALPVGVCTGQPLVRFPFLAPADVDADAVIAALRGRGIVAGSWYRPALFPGVADPAVYGYAPGDSAAAVTEDIVARIVNLPTNVSADRARGIAQETLEVIDSCRGGRA